MTDAELLRWARFYQQASVLNGEERESKLVSNGYALALELMNKRLADEITANALMAGNTTRLHAAGGKVVPV
jgi:hypothetical protein